MASKSSVRTKRAGSKPAKKSSGSASSKPAKPASDRKKPVTSAKRTPARTVPAAVPRPKPRAGNGQSQQFAVDKLHQVALQATNLDAAVNFYRDILGLRFITRFDPPGLAFFDMGGFRLLLSATASGATLYFRVSTSTTR